MADKMTMLCKSFEVCVRSALQKNLTGIDFVSMSGPLTNEEVVNLIAMVDIVLFNESLTTHATFTHVNDYPNQLVILTKNRHGQEVSILLNVPGAEARKPVIQGMFDIALEGMDQVIHEEVKELAEFEKELRAICPKDCVVSRKDNEDPEESRFAEIMQRNKKVFLFIWHENGDFSNLWDDFNEEFLGPLKTLMEKYKEMIHYERLDSTAVIVSFENYL